MAYFLDFIKQSSTATYLTTTEKFTVEKYGSVEAAKRAASTRYHELMKDALGNQNINYANCVVKTDANVIIVSDIQGEYKEKVPNEESEE